MFPVRHLAEKMGTVVNVAGIVQRVRPAVEPAWEAWSDGEVIAKLGALLGLDGFDGAYDVQAVSKDLSEAIPDFADVHLDAVGEGGRPLSDAEESRP